eukprot:1077211-Pleurochrysis_carterae.AAC.1
MSVESSDSAKSAAADRMRAASAVITLSCKSLDLGARSSAWDSTAILTATAEMRSESTGIARSCATTSSSILGTHDSSPTISQPRSRPSSPPQLACDESATFSKLCIDEALAEGAPTPSA